MTEVRFVKARGQNLFFDEIVEALRFELELLGVATSESYVFDEMDEDRVYALIAPHEWFALNHGVEVDDAWLARTVMISAEQPYTHFFDRNIELARKAGAVFDINPQGVREMRHQGMPAEHLRLGYTERWLGDPERTDRPTDVLFMGCHSQKRAAALSAYGRSLMSYSSKLVLSDNGSPNPEQSENFYTGDAKRELLSQSRVLLNIHQDDRPYFEWLRVIEAIHCGCAVVTEHSSDIAPLIAPTHLLSGRPESLVLLASRLLDDEPFRQDIARTALDQLRSEAPMAKAAEALAETATGLSKWMPVSPARAVWEPQAKVFPDASDEMLDGPENTTDDWELSAIRRALRDIRLDLRALGRELADANSPELEQVGGIRVVARSKSYLGVEPRVTVVTPLYDHREHIVDMLDSAARLQQVEFELIVVDDGSSDGSGDVVQAWMEEHSSVPMMLLRHEVNRGLPSTRNTAIAFARGEFCLMLDSDNEVYAGCAKQLVDAMDADSDAEAAYGMLEVFNQDGPAHLLSFFPMDASRLRIGNIVDALALFRTATLREIGGYVVDDRLHGWEDYDMWCVYAEQGRKVAFVPQIVARYRDSANSMISLSNLSVTAAYATLVERHPNLMQGVQVPL